MRLIDADALMKGWICGALNERVWSKNDFLDSIDEQKTVDAVPVVRCKDCIESAILGDPDENRRYCAHLGCRVEDEGFCADGRRETDPDPTDDC